MFIITTGTLADVETRLPADELKFTFENLGANEKKIASGLTMYKDMLIRFVLYPSQV